MKKISVLALCLALLLCVSLVAMSAGGDEGDPAVTQSYVEQIWRPEMVAAAVAEARLPLLLSYNESLTELARQVAEENLAAAQKQNGVRSAMGKVLLKEGDVFYPSAGCRVSLISGSVGSLQEIADVTNGQLYSGPMVPNTVYMQAGIDSPGIAVTSPTAELQVNGNYRITLSDRTDYGSLADALAAMGLFRGMSDGYALEGSTTRAQGLVMFLRLLGREAEALQCTAEIPFADVPAGHWAYPYVAYAYTNGLTNGVSTSAFAPDAPVTAQHYLTFLMRALHFAEGAAFTYNTVLSDAVAQGLFGQEEISVMSDGAFLRYKMVYLSYYALFCTDAESHTLLLETLISAGAVEEDAAYAGLAAPRGWRLPAAVSR